MRNLFIAFVLLFVGVFSSLSSGPSLSPQPASALENCSVSVSTPGLGNQAVVTKGSFSCPAPATVNTRHLQICLYMNGVQEACNYSTLKSYSNLSLSTGCAAYSTSPYSNRFTAWVWFKDQYGATYAKWSHNIYLYRSCY